MTAKVLGGRLGRFALMAIPVLVLVLVSPAIAAVYRQSIVHIAFSANIHESEKPAVRKLLQRFSSLSGVRAELTSIDKEDLPDTIERERRAEGKSVHLFARDNVALAALLEGDLVQDVSDIPIPSEVIPGLRNMPGTTPGGSRDRYFLPFRPNVRLVYANRKCLDQAGVRPPTTTAELRRVAGAVRDAGGRPRLTLSLGPGDPAAVTLSELVLSYGGKPLDLTSREAGEAFSFLQTLWADGALADRSWQGDFDTEVRNLQDGSSCLAQNWSFTSAQLAKTGRLRDFAVSAGWSGPAGRYSVVGGDVLGIPRGVTGKQLEAAAALARFLMSREAQEVLVQDNGWPSIRTDAYGDVRQECGGGERLQCGPLLAAARPSELRDTFSTIEEALERGWYRPSVKEWDVVTARLNAAACLVTVHGEPVVPTLARLQAMSDAVEIRSLACSVAR